MPTGFRTWHTQRRYQYIVGISSPEAIDAYLHRGQGYSMWDEMPERYRDNVRTAISGAADLVAHPTHAIRAIRRDWQEEGLVGVLGAANRNLNPLYGVSKSGANWVQAMREGRYEDAVRAGVDWTVATEGALLAGKGTLKVGESVLGRLRGALSREVPTEAALAAEGELGAYETAVEGGRHAGFLENYANKPIAEIERGIGSIEKQIAQHQSWIEDPYQHIPEWDKLDPRQQNALLNRKWPGDIQRQQEQLQILRRILEDRG